MRSQRFDIGHEIPGGVLAQLTMRPALSAATLVHQHDAIALRIEETAHRRVGPAPRAAMQEYGRLAVTIAALLVVDLMQR